MSNNIVLLGRTGSARAMTSEEIPDNQNNLKKMEYARHHKCRNPLTWRDEIQINMYGSDDSIQFIRFPERFRLKSRFQFPTVKHGG